MPIRIIFFLVLLAALTFWQGCGQSDFNDSEVNRSVTQADDESSNNTNDDDSSDDDTNDDDSTDTTAPTVSSSSPADSATSVSVSSTIAVTFSEAMDTTTVTTNTSNSTCSGSLQVSSDNFSTCVQMIASPSATNSNKTYTLTPTSKLTTSTNYKFRVTIIVNDIAGNEIASQWTTSNGFTTSNWLGTQQIFDGNSGQPNPARDVATDSSGNIYVAGYTNGTMDGVTSASGNDLYVLKYDSTGTKEWSKQLGSSSRDEAYGIVVDTLGNVFIGGHTSGGLDGNTNSRNSDVFLVKYDLNGLKQWTKQFGSGSSYGERVSGIAIDLFDNVFLVGDTFAFSDESGLDNRTHPGGGYSAFVVCYDSTGKRRWTNLLGTNNWDKAYGVATSSSGNVFITGYTSGELDGNLSLGSKDVFLAKYSNNGAKLWSKQIGTSSNDEGKAVTADSSENVYVVGFTEGGFEGYTIAGDQKDIFIAKFNSNGSNLWIKQFGTSSHDHANDVATDSLGNIYLVGSSEGNFDGYFNSGRTDLIVIKYDSAGTMKWLRQFGTSGYDRAYGVDIDTKNNVYVVGETGGSLDGNSFGGQFDMFLMLYDSDGNRK